MSLPLEPTSTLDRIRRNLVGLKMARALEVLDQTVRQIERGEMTALDAIDTLLAEELTLRQNRREDGADDGPDHGGEDAGRLRLCLPALARSQSDPHAGAAGLHRSARSRSSAGPTRHRQIALGRGARGRGHQGGPHYFSTPADLIASLAKAEREGTLRERIRFLSAFALLIVDEIGYLPVVPGGGNLFFQLVNARYEKGAPILTSNRGFAEWGEVFGDPVVATALLDRLLHHAVVIQIEGSSYRLRQHADLMPEHVRSKALITPPPAPRRRGRPPGGKSNDHPTG